MSMSALLSAILLASGHASAPERHATYVSASADDDLTQKFADALREALPKSRHMRLATGDDRDDLTLAVLFRVQPEGRRFTYAVDLMRSTGDPTPERVASFTGRCDDRAIAACALDLVKKADGRAKD